MQKKLFCLFVVLLFTYTAESQSVFGVKAGVNLANQMKTISIPQVPATSEKTDPVTGYQLGFFYKKQLFKGIKFSAETNFSLIGSSSKLVAPSLTVYYTKEKLGYLDVPLTLQFFLHKFYIGIGPAIGFKLFSKLKGFEDKTFDISHYRTPDVSGTALAGVSLTQRWDANVRYSHGLTNIYKDPGGAVTKNRFFNFSVLYRLK